MAVHSPSLLVACECGASTPVGMGLQESAVDHQLSAHSMPVRSRMPGWLMPGCSPRVTVWYSSMHVQVTCMQHIQLHDLPVL